MWENDRLIRRQALLKYGTVTFVVLVLIAGIASWYVLSRRNESPFPPAIRTNTNLTLFYPTTLPEGYALDETSIDQTNDVISYVAEKPGKPSRYINFSIQPRADKFDFNTFYNTTLVKSFKFTTTLGEATVGSMQSNGNTVGSLINGDTWIIVSAPAAVKSSEVQTIIADLKTVQ
ncbi:MAG TPA: hypothetical protein VD735_00680 [Candidatus Saccharimonadales bacterium]|nr:hypothetical protein [Candidatus Saccharimonadales bacterium]